jgi:hypothetical protein
MGSEIESLANRDCISQCRYQIEAESIAKEWKMNSRPHVHRSLKKEARRVGYLLSCHELRCANNWNKSAGAVTACGKTIKFRSDFFAPILRCVTQAAIRTCVHKLKRAQQRWSACALIAVCDKHDSASLAGNQVRIFFIGRPAGPKFLSALSLPSIDDPQGQSDHFSRFLGSAREVTAPYCEPAI